MIHEQSLGRNCQIRGHRGDCGKLLKSADVHAAQIREFYESREVRKTL